MKIYSGMGEKGNLPLPKVTLADQSRLLKGFFPQKSFELGL
jgi:hypothetical protein